MPSKNLSSEKKLRRLNAILRAIRNINQLIVSEKNRGVLIKRSCELLVENPGFKSAWIVLFDAQGKYLDAAQAGVGTKFSALKRRLKDGVNDFCVQSALKQDGVVRVEDAALCGECPLHNDNAGRCVVATRLQHETTIRGALVISVNREFLDAREEFDLINEAAGDIAFALHSLEIDAERKKAQADLLDREESLRITLNSIGDAVISTDVKGNVARLNPVAEQLTGWSKEAARGLPLKKVFHIINEETRKKVENPVDKVMREGHVVGLANHTLLIAKDGRETPIADSGAPIMDDDGDIVGVVLTFRDQTKERQAEELQTRLAAIVESSDDAIVGKRMDGHITSWNDAAEKIYGYSADEIVGEHISRLIPKERQEEMSRILAKIGQGERILPFETTRVHKDGRIIHVSVTVSPIIGPGGEKLGAASIARDITAHKQAEALLHEQAAWNQLILDTTMDGFILADAEGKIEDVNNSYCRLTGYSREELLAMNIRQVEAKLSDEEVERRIQQLVNAGHDRFETQHRAGDGRLIDLDVNIAVVQVKDRPPKVAAFVRDITEQKVAQQARQEREENLRTTLNSIGDAVIATDAEGTITAINPVAAKLTGWPAAEAMGQPVAEVFHIVNAFSMERVDDPAKLVMKTGKIVGLANSTMLLSKDGPKYQIADSGAPIRAADGQIIGVVLVFRDVTADYEKEQQLKLYNLKLRQAQEIANVGWWEWNIRTDEIDFSDELTRLHGLPQSKNKLSLERWLKYVHPKDRRLLRRAHQASLSTGALQAAFRIKRADTEEPRFFKAKGIVRFSAAGEPEYQFGVAIDVTEEERAKEALIESEEKFSKAFMASPVLKTITRLDSGEIIDVNDSFIKHTGYSREELIGRKTTELNLWVEPRQRQEVLKVLAAGDMVRGMDVQMRTRNDDVLDTYFSTEKITIENEEFLISIAMDVTERKRAELALAQSEERFRLAFYTSPDSININRLKDGLYVDINQGFTEITGYTRDEVIGKTSLEINIWADPADRQRLVQGLKTRGRVTNLEAKFRMKDGTIVAGLMSACVFMLQDEAHILSVARNIEEMKQAQESLRKSEERFRTVVDHAGDALYVADFDTEQILFVNKRACNMLGYSQQELLQLKVSDLDPVFVKEKHRKKIWPQFIPAETTTIEVVHRKKDGSAIPVEVRTGIIDFDGRKAVLGYARDIRERKQAEEALKESEKRLIAAEHIAKMGDFTWDVNSGRVTWSDAMFDLLKFSKNEKIDYNRVNAEIHHADDLPRVTKWLKECVDSGGEELTANEYRLVRRDGQVIYVRTQGVIKRKDDGSVIVFATCQDITERKMAEEKVRKLHEELEQRVQKRTAQLQNANQDLEAFAYSVSHDLRAPLRHIAGFAGLLQRDLLKDKPRPDYYFQKISQAVDNMRDRIDDLLTFSRIGRTKLTRVEVDLNELVNEVVSEQEQDIAGREIHWNIAKLPAVKGDAVLLKSVMENLISNAIKFTAGKKVAEIEIGSSVDGQYVRCFVKDNGVGFDENYSHKLFNVFQRLHSDDEFPGTGIGLANVKRIVERLGGAVGAQGSEGGGALFYFTLPLD